MRGYEDTQVESTPCVPQKFTQHFEDPANFESTKSY